MSGGRTKRRLPNWGVGLIILILVVFGFYLSFTKRLPFTSQGYQVKGVFRDAQNVAVNSPVRIAGVNVGAVTNVETLPESNAAVVTMTIKDAGRPIHEDARLQLRPRLFLEGNLFVDIRPGSPSSPELDSGDEIPIQQTANSVQLDQILTTLQANVRGNLQIAFKEVGDAFEKYGGAEGLRDFNRSGGPAYKNTALVNEAFLGTRVHDLSHLVRNFDTVVASLDRDKPALQDLVTNLRTVTGSFAAQDQALKSAVHQLPGTLFAARPVFTNLNRSFPFVRAFAREALPGVRSTPETLTVATPFIYQLRKLVSKPELRGLVKDLRPTVPQLAKLTRGQIPFMEEARALSSCFNNVIIPWSSQSVSPSPLAGEPAAGKIYEETGYELAGIAGESRSGDANGQYIRVEAGGGANTLSVAPDQNIISQTIGGESTVGVLDSAIKGAEPAFDSSAKTPFKPGVPCETQSPPDLRSGGAATVPGQSRSTGSTANSPVADLSRKYADIYMNLMHAQQVGAQGNALRASKLDDQVNQQFQAFQKNDMADYIDAVKNLTGVGK